MRRAAFLYASLAFLGLSARPAFAQIRQPAVQLSVEGCGDAPTDEIRRVVGIELHAELAGDEAPHLADTTRVEVTCKGALADLVVDDAITGKSLSRSIDIEAAAPNSRARLIALAVTELVSASWTEVESNPTPAVPPAGPRPSPAAVDATRQSVRARIPSLAPRSFRVLALGTARVVFGETTLLGVGARAASGDGEHPFGYRLDLTFEHGSESTALGAVGMDAAGAAAAALFHGDFARALSAHVGAGARYGYVRLTGQSAEGIRGDTVTGSFLGPLVTAGLTVSVAGRLRADLDVEGGYALVPVKGHVFGAPDVGVQGGWAGAILGFGFVP